MKHTRERSRIIFGQQMEPCPKCKSYNFRTQTPIEMECTGKETARQLLGKYARAIKAGATPLQGPVYIMCFECGHKGPSLDCSGRTSEDVGKDREVATKVKQLWNDQEN